MMLRRGINLRSVVNSQFLSRVCNFCTRAEAILDKENGEIQSISVEDRRISSANYLSRIHLSPLFLDGRAHSDGYDIEVVDHETWQVTSGLAQAWQQTDRPLETRSLTNAVDDCCSPVESDPDFDDIDNMRIRGNLFYKLDRDSKEFEEYNFDFHRRKSLGKIDDRKENKKRESSKNKDDRKGSNKESCNVTSGGEKLPKVARDKLLLSQLDETESSGVGKKKLRTPTFNQLTGPYHEPFCLDIYISKASVRACIIHRVTSKVVAVAHSISKDMKFDLGSTRNATACAAVGGVLAQRALADDIHDVNYTPRKGEKLEGKLQIVLQSIIDNGVNVKVKLKQRRPKKADHAYR